MMFRHAPEVSRALHTTGLWTRLYQVLDASEPRLRDSPFYAGINFGSDDPGCGQEGGGLSGWVEVCPRPGELTVVVRRVPADRWVQALAALGHGERATPVDALTIGPLDDRLPGWLQQESFKPGMVNGRLALSAGVHARTWLADRDGTTNKTAGATFAPAAREDCEAAWEAGVDFLDALLRTAPAPSPAS
ncbi:hypothetical protein [Streptomyces sp. NPDC015350]|uniref:hypothetical protein n=1 Tax=Streptomyces sp. NPDC015350 TaxID=3364955 RepID=UPI0037010233